MRGSRGSSARADAIQSTITVRFALTVVCIIGILAWLFQPESATGISSMSAESDTDLVDDICDTATALAQDISSLVTSNETTTNTTKLDDVHAVRKQSTAWKSALRLLLGLFVAVCLWWLVQLLRQQPHVDESRARSADSVAEDQMSGANVIEKANQESIENATSEKLTRNRTLKERMFRALRHFWDCMRLFLVLWGALMVVYELGILKQLSYFGFLRQLHITIGRWVFWPTLNIMHALFSNGSPETSHNKQYDDPTIPDAVKRMRKEFRDTVLKTVGKEMTRFLSLSAVAAIFWRVWHRLKDAWSGSSWFDTLFPQPTADLFGQIRCNISLTLIPQHVNLHERAEMRTLREVAVEEVFPKTQDEGLSAMSVLSDSLSHVPPYGADNYGTSFAPFVDIKPGLRKHLRPQTANLAKSIKDHLKNQISSLFSASFVAQDILGRDVVEEVEYAYGVTWERDEDRSKAETAARKLHRNNTKVRIVLARKDRLDNLNILQAQERQTYLYKKIQMYQNEAEKKQKNEQKLGTLQEKHPHLKGDDDPAALKCFAAKPTMPTPQEMAEDSELQRAWRSGARADDKCMYLTYIIARLAHLIRLKALLDQQSRDTDDKTDGYLVGTVYLATIRPLPRPYMQPMQPPQVSDRTEDDIEDDKDDDGESAVPRRTRTRTRTQRL